MKRRIIWGVLLLLTFLIFYAWMPAGMYLQMPILLAIIGGIVCFFFLVQVFADFREFEEVAQWDKYRKEWYHNMSFVCIPVGIVLMIVFGMHYSKLEDEELKQFGETVPATIVDGYSRSSSKSSTYKLTVSYYTKKGKHVRRQQDVSSAQYNDASKGQHVEVIYSTKHPSLMKILLGDKIIQEFTGVKSRKLNLADMTRLLDLPGDSILPALNKISYRWIPAEDDSASYINENKELYLTAHPRTRITYVATGEDVFSFSKDLKASGFKQDSTSNAGEGEEKAVRLYAKDNILLMVQTKTLEKHVDRSDNSSSAIAAAFAPAEIALVVTMFKN
jgi:hypothetical protein